MLLANQGSKVPGESQGDMTRVHEKRFALILG